MNKGAVFFDLYGTLAHEVGYPNHPSRLQLFPWTIPALHKVKYCGYSIVVVSNQTCVMRGYTTQIVLDAIIEKFHALLAMENLTATVLYASAIDDAHPCRKPNPGMAHEAEAILDFRISETDNWMVGDSIKDMRFAVNAGINNDPCLVLTGYGRGIVEYDYSELIAQAPDTRIFTNAEAAVDFILVES